MLCRATVLAATIASAMGGMPTPAYAQSSGLDGSDPGIRRSVQDLMRTGIEEYRKHNYEGALDAFTKAWTLQPHAEIAANLARISTALRCRHADWAAVKPRIGVSGERIPERGIEASEERAIEFGSHRSRSSIGESDQERHGAIVTIE